MSAAEYMSIVPLAGQLSLKNIFFRIRNIFGGKSQAIAAFFPKFQTSRLIEHAKNFPKHHNMQQSDICSQIYLHSPMSSMFQKNCFGSTFVFGGESQAIAALFANFRASHLVAHTKRVPKHPHMQQSDVCGPRYMHPPMSSMFEKQFLSDDWLEFGSVAIAKAALSS